MAERDYKREADLRADDNLKLCQEIDGLNAEVDRLKAEKTLVEQQIDEIQAAHDRLAGENAKLRAAHDRLNASLRWTHETYCDSAYTDRGLHAPECMLHDVEDLGEAAGGEGAGDAQDA